MNIVYGPCNLYFIDPGPHRETQINIVCRPYIPDFTVYMIYIDDVGDEVLEIFQIEVILLNMVLLVAIL